MTEDTNKRIDELMADIVQIICGASGCTPSDFMSNHNQAVIQRIRLSCEALIGIALEPDVGPWVADLENGTIQSNDFTHDVYLKVDGDFWDTHAKNAYITALTTKLNTNT